MATLELDPMFRRGLRLLHSRNRDSVEQLKLLLDEAVRQRQGKPLPPINKVGHYAPPNAKDPFALRRESPTPIPRPRQSSPIPLSLKRDDHKKDKIRDEDNLVSAKRPRLDSPMGFKSHTPSPTPSLKSESSRSRKSDESDSDEMNDLAMEIMDGINCNVCKSFEVSSRNQLVECQECHALYHQECHKPPVTDQDVNDPRLVWYCAKCTKTMKKQGGLLSSNSSNGGSSSGSVTRSSGQNFGCNLQGVTPVSANSTKSSSTLPTRPTASPTKGLGLSRPSPFTNLASANTGRSLGVVNSGSSSSMKGGLGCASSSNSSSNSKAAAPSNSMLSAERRMHMMKKKAAAKMAEKRKL